MNSLKRTIKEGEIVVVSNTRFKKPQPIENRLLRCNGSGFGTSAETAGTAVYGEWLSDSVKGRIEGHWIDAGETAEWQGNQS